MDSSIDNVDDLPHKSEKTASFDERQYCVELVDDLTQMAIVTGDRSFGRSVPDYDGGVGVVDEHVVWRCGVEEEKTAVREVHCCHVDVWVDGRVDV